MGSWGLDLSLDELVVGRITQFTKHFYLASLWKQRAGYFSEPVALCVLLFSFITRSSVVGQTWTTWNRTDKLKEYKSWVPGVGMLRNKQPYRSYQESLWFNICGSPSSSHIRNLHRKRKLGVKMVLNRLHAMGHRVQRTRVRDAMALLFGQRQRNRRLKRRVYSVRAPLSVIHFDGNHNLIMWRFVFHGGIDGFSRLIFFLQVANNNRSRSVFNGFLKGVRKYGVPSRVRADHGGENVLVGQFMLITPAG
uniref:Integrase core domain-containing protein n=1 Tax=Daphnia galeata TaxID=27404 RepID=A0A8J2RTQ2_9CRUS|nr:unnamed protein product [Daphnia galeata]